jgi:hypothetical protein
MDNDESFSNSVHSAADAELTLQNSSITATTVVSNSAEPLKIVDLDESSDQFSKKRKAVVRKRSSRIWDHFEVVENSNSRTGYYITCQHCNWRILYSRGSGTSGCNKHMTSSSCPYFSKNPNLGSEFENSMDQSSQVISSSRLGVSSPNPSNLHSQSSSDPDMVRVAAIQMSCSSDKRQNINKAIRMVRNAAEQGAQVILLQELFEGEYFCQEQSDEYFTWAHEVNLNSKGESMEAPLMVSPGAGSHSAQPPGNIPYNLYFPLLFLLKYFYYYYHCYCLLPCINLFVQYTTDYRHEHWEGI